ncbi:MAG TPA: PEPxxWA-CTERM sorting domain-containing protein [Rhizomicrobium sp.]|nr:PEPxxWA-CTERM sorting domain-containing protein [Rhizomicrobium sp.]
MKIVQTLAASAFALAAFGTAAANASIVISDNFDSSGTPGPNWSGDGIFQSIPQPGNVQGMPSVDLVGNVGGPAYFSSLAFSGNSIDLDGSTGNGHSPAGEIRSITSLALGDYTVEFDLAGNLRGATPETTIISLGSQSYSFTPLAIQAYTHYTLYFTGVSGQLDFQDQILSDQQGNLLDNVVVTTGVPEPASWMLMIAGFGALGFGLRGRRKAGAVAAA